jgi:quinol monooxygenase YgiN
MIHVIALITAHPGRRGDILAAFHAHAAAIRAEAGCIEYAPAIDARGVPQPGVGGDTLVVIEKWASLAALRDHAAGEPVRSFLARIEPFTAARMIHVLEPAGPG